MSGQWCSGERRRAVDTTVATAVTTEDTFHDVDRDEVEGSGWWNTESALSRRLVDVFLDAEEIGCDDQARLLPKGACAGTWVLGQPRPYNLEIFKDIFHNFLFL